MGDELSCLTELLCCCILLEDAEYTNNMNNLRNNPQINHMERNEGNNVTIIEEEPLLKDTFKTNKTIKVKEKLN